MILNGCIRNVNGCDDDFILTGEDDGQPFTDPEPLSEYEPWLVENLVKPSVTEAVEQIRAAAPNAHVQLIGYPALIDPAAGCVDGLGAGEVGFLNDLAVTFAETYTHLNSMPDVDFMSTIADFRGHGVCSRELSWLNGLVLIPEGGADTGVPGIPSFHPTAVGYANEGQWVSDQTEWAWVHLVMEGRVPGSSQANVHPMISRWSTGWRTVATDALRGVLVGALLGLVTALMAAPAYQCSRPGLECLPVTLGVIGAAMLMGVLLGWVLLLILRVRRAMLLAIGGMVATLLLAAAVGGAGAGEAAGELAPMAGMGATGYGTTATALSGQSPAPVRIAAAAVLVIGMVILLAQM